MYPNYSDVTRPEPLNGRVVGEPSHKWHYLRKLQVSETRKIQVSEIFADTPVARESLRTDRGR